LARIKLCIAYDGTHYYGWQRQSTLPTVQGKIEAALKRLTQKNTSLYGAGRTDAGVHALAQVAHFNADRPFTNEDWRRALNALLPSDIVVKRAEALEGDFHARFSAKSKTYRYQIRNALLPSPFDYKRTWLIQDKLDLGEMSFAAETFVGLHDFRSFCASGAEVQTHLVEMRNISIEKKQEQIEITLEASRFLQHMVRNIVGFLVEVGRKKRPPEAAAEVLAALDRRAAGLTAPPQGLFLVRVDY